MKLIKKYRFFVVTAVLMGILLIINKEIGMRALNITLYTLREMLLFIPPVFIILGLLDVWVPKETMMKFMGEGSGIKGVLVAFLIGSAAAGPLYGAFPVAVIFMKKGVKFLNLLVFIGAWSTTKIPMFLVELSSLGKAFAITRLLINIPGILLIAYVLTSLVSKEEIAIIYKNAQST